MLLNLLALLAAQTAAEPTPTRFPKAEAAPKADVPAEKEKGVHFRAGGEVDFSLYGSATGPTDEYDGFLGLRPILSFTAADLLEIELGPWFRLRMLDNEPRQRSGDIGGILRGEDWNSLSNFGQILQALNFDSSAVTIRAGAVRKKTLGYGHLINRYSNQDNPNYHPAGADVSLDLGPTHTEVFASDILGARLFAMQFSLDAGKLFFNSQNLHNRFLVSLEVAHDFALAGVPLTCAEVCLNNTGAIPITLGHFDASAVVLRNQYIRLMILAGFGGRGLLDPTVGTRGIGALFGVAADFNILSGRFTTRVELRKNNAGFRQGMFGPGYELARFSGIGFANVSLGKEVLPDGYSVYGDVRSAFGDLVTADAVFEYFTVGRSDLDVAVSVNLVGSRLVGSARFTAVGLNQAARYSFTGSLRYRPIPSLYFLAQGGTLAFPLPDGTLLKGATGGLGIGADFDL